MRLLRKTWFVAATLAVAATVQSAPQPGAFELLEQVRQTYAELESYSDLGELEVTTGRGQTRLLFFETAASAEGTFVWRTHGEKEAGFEERVVWSDGEETFVYSSMLQQYKPVPSLISELAHGWGPGAYDALLVPLLLAGAGDSLADPSAASIEGREPCGRASCWILSLTRMAGAIECELRIDEETRLIHEVLVRLTHPPALLEPSSGTPTGEGPLTIQTRHHTGGDDPPAFVLPAGARLVAAFEPRTEGSETSTTDPWAGSTFEEEITVALVEVVARIVDSTGEPILDLEPDDLVVRVGQAETPVLSLEWSSSYPTTDESPELELLEARGRVGARPAAPAIAAPLPSPGKLVVFFLQIDLEPSRVAGHLKILPDVDNLLRGLHPDDRVAIVSFDSHLKLWQDFTRDRRAAFQELGNAIGYGRPAARQSRGVSLLRHFDRRAAADVATPEKALQLTAQALAQLPGQKEMIYMGWGLGRYGAGGVNMTAEYQPAVRALDAARTTVFVLDVSQADYHSLEVGLQNVAAHTGGTYERTFHFASQAVKRLARTIGGHYVLTLDRGATPKARGRVTMRLRHKKGRILFKPLTLG